MVGCQSKHVQVKAENQHGTGITGTSASTSHTHEALRADVERVLEAARPHLRRFASRWGVRPDATDDVVQETLLEAWHSLDHLRSPERFDAWLLSICRNVCQQWAEREHRHEYHRLEGTRDVQETLAEDLADPLVSDPAEAVSRQDLVTLLDRALGYLPAATRSALELHYWAELPPCEPAPGWTAQRPFTPPPGHASHGEPASAFGRSTRLAGIRWTAFPLAARSPHGTARDVCRAGLTSVLLDVWDVHRCSLVLDT